MEALESSEFPVAVNKFQHTPPPATSLIYVEMLGNAKFHPNIWLKPEPKWQPSKPFWGLFWLVAEFAQFSLPMVGLNRRFTGEASSDFGQMGFDLEFWWPRWQMIRTKPMRYSERRAPFAPRQVTTGGPMEEICSKALRSKS